MQEEKEKREIPTPAILLTMLGQLNDKAFEKEAVLQCEESGANIAKLQGFLAGVRKYKTAHARKRLHIRHQVRRHNRVQTFIFRRGRLRVRSSRIARNSSGNRQLGRINRIRRV